MAQRSPAWWLPKQTAVRCFHRRSAVSLSTLTGLINTRRCAQVLDSVREACALNDVTCRVLPLSWGEASPELIQLGLPECCPDRILGSDCLYDSKACRERNSPAAEIHHAASYWLGVRWRLVYRRLLLCEESELRIRDNVPGVLPLAENSSRNAPES